jgi:hypothetical protein
MERDDKQPSVVSEGKAEMFGEGEATKSTLSRSGQAVSNR